MSQLTRVMTNNNVSPLTIYTGGSGIVLGKANPIQDQGAAISNGLTATSHSHPNKFVLDGLSVNSEDLLKYYSNNLNIPLIQEDW